MSIQSTINSMLSSVYRGVAIRASIKALSEMGGASARENRAENARENRAENAPDNTRVPTTGDTSSAAPSASAVAGAVARERVTERFMSLTDTKEAYIEHMKALHDLFQGKGDAQTLKTIRDTQYDTEKEEKLNGYKKGGI